MKTPIFELMDDEVELSDTGSTEAIEVAETRQTQPSSSSARPWEAQLVQEQANSTSRPNSGNSAKRERNADGKNDQNPSQTPTQNEGGNENGTNDTNNSSSRSPASSRPKAPPVSTSGPKRAAEESAEGENDPKRQRTDTGDMGNDTTQVNTVPALPVEPSQRPIAPMRQSRVTTGSTTQPPIATSQPQTPAPQPDVVLQSGSNAPAPPSSLEVQQHSIDGIMNSQVNQYDPVERQPDQGIGYNEYNPFDPFDPFDPLDPLDLLDTDNTYGNFGIDQDYRNSPPVAPAAEPVPSNSQAFTAGQTSLQSIADLLTEFNNSAQQPLVSPESPLLPSASSIAPHNATIPQQSHEDSLPVLEDPTRPAEAAAEPSQNTAGATSIRQTHFAILPNNYPQWELEGFPAEEATWHNMYVNEEEDGENDEECREYKDFDPFTHNEENLATAQGADKCPNVPAWPCQHANDDIMRTCDICQMNKIGPVIDQLCTKDGEIDRSKRHLCTLCANQVVREGRDNRRNLTRRKCHCVRQLTGGWLCLVHRELAINNWRRKLEAMNEIPRPGLDNYFCPQCRLQDEDNTSGVWQCMVCGQLVEDKKKNEENKD